MAKQSVIASNEQAVLLATNLIEIAQCGGLEITITIPPKNHETPLAADTTDQDQHSYKGQKRSDFAWLQARVTQRPDELVRLRNHYVAVYDKRIVSIGDSKELVLVGAAASLNVLPDAILVVPVQVFGSESEEEWLNLQRELGIV